MINRLERKNLTKEAATITNKRIDKIQEQRLVEHILFFKVVESHYVRKKESSKRFNSFIDYL